MIMKVITSVISAVALVAAHGDDYLHARHVHQRQASSSPRPSSASSVSSAPVTVTVSSAIGSGSVTAAPTTTAPNITVSLLSTNPTAVPLASIVSNASTGATQPLASTAAPGSTPTFLPNAPPLPNPVTLNPANYPKLDIPPPTDSPEVLRWIQEVEDTGIVIPGFAPTSPGGCPNNTAAVADTTRCWWTCTGCVASFDITQCPDQLHWGLTYDDGPSFYTSKLLSYLDQQNLKSTFFVVGSRALQFPATLQLEYMSQHQIAVHTWSHPPLTTLSNEEIIAELGWSRKIIKDVLGVTPNMMRPPYGDIDNRVRAISVAMGLTPVIWTRLSPQVTFDTGDFNIHSGITTVGQVLQNWQNIISNVSTINNGFIVLEHDLFEQTVEVATGYILPDALAHKPPFVIQPVVDCLHMPLANAYIETNDNKTNPPVISGTAVTIIPPTATGANSGSTSSADACFSFGIGLTFMTTTTALLATLIAARF